MKEKNKHILLFERYYAMGQERSLRKLHQQLQAEHEQTGAWLPSLDALFRWSKEFHWQERIEQREIENTQALRKKIEAQTNETIINRKAEYRATIKVIHNMTKASLNRAIEDIRAGNIPEVRSVQDMKTLSDILDRLARLENELMGESKDDIYNIVIEPLKEKK